MESGQIFVIVIVALVTGSITLSSFAHAFARSRGRKVNADERRRLDAIEARLSRIEDSIEAVAVEMERVAEGQRFTSKLLTERAAPGAAVAASRSVPPSESGRSPRTDAR